MSRVKKGRNKAFALMSAEESAVALQKMDDKIWKLHEEWEQKYNQAINAAQGKTISPEAQERLNAIHLKIYVLEERIKKLKNPKEVEEPLLPNLPK